MTPLQKEMYDLIVKNFGDPQKIRFMKSAGLSRHRFQANMDYALAMWAMELRQNNMCRASIEIGINRNTMRRILARFTKPKSPVSEFMDGLRVDSPPPTN